MGRFDAFRWPAFRRYTIAWLFTSMGTRVQSVAIGWEMYARTGEALSLGIVGLMQALPTIALALPAGALADRMDRKRLMMISLGAMTVTSLGLALVAATDGATWLMYTILLLDASAVILGRPARVALVPGLVPRKVFPNAATWNIALMQISSVVGPAIGGMIVTVSVPVAFVVAAGSSLAFLVAVSAIKVRPVRRPVVVSAGSHLLEGIRFVSRARVILVTISLDLFAVLLGGAVYLLPVFAEDVFEVGARGFGLLRSAPAWGAMVMALGLALLPPIRRAGWALLLSVAAFGVATIVFGLTDSFWVAFAMLVLTGAFDNVSMVIRHTLQQLLTPDAMRGRVAAVTSIFVGASNELGGLESGVVAHWFGPVVSVVSGGIGTLVVVAAAALGSPKLRAIDRLADVEPVAWTPTGATRPDGARPAGSR